MSRGVDTRVRLRATRRGRAVAGAVLALTAGGGLIAGCGGSSNATPPAGSYSVRAIFDSAAFVLPGLDVRVSGVKIGQVNGVELTDDNQAAVTFTITDDGFKDFRKDATCTIRPQALIGERYLACELTQPRPEGATAPAALPTIESGKYKGQHLLPVEQTYVPVDADQLISANTPSVRERLFIIVRELGAGVAGRGDKINATLRKSNEGLRYANRILEQLANQTEMLKQLDATADTTLASLASERGSISGTVKNGAVVAERLAARQSEVRASIASLNTLLTEVSPSVDRVTDLTDQLAPIAEDLDASSADLATIINDLPSASSRAKTAINALGPTLDQGREILTSSDTDALIDRLTKTAGGVKTTASVLGLTLGDFRATGGLDYLLDTIYGLAYTTNGRDANGSYLRGLTINAPFCALPTSSASTACGRRLTNQVGGLPKGSAASSSSAPAASASSASDGGSDSSSDNKAADLLFGGGR
ncbi:MAG: MCE family protein [Solirubrobacteraceae bacterium]|nr:MCE family protein [Solirubrobacteraceae bacterium]